MTQKLAQIYQLKVTLKDTKPPIWRRIEVSSDIPLSKLHRVLQVAMGWSNSHLHQFIVGDALYGEPDPDYGGWVEMHDERRARLAQIAPTEKSKFIYEYDFGDSWNHVVVVEKIMLPQPETQYPRCIKGVGACPPEDCGGIWGFYNFVEVMADPQHPEHEDMVEWWGDDQFDPNAFEPDVINAELKRLR